MISDESELFSSLRASTAVLLGYDADKQLSPAEQIRLDRASALRMVIDGAQAKQMRGEPIDVREFTDASESLEKMCGGNPASSATRFGPDHRARLRQLIEKTLLTPSVDEEALDDAMRREEAIQAQAAGVPVEAPAAPPPPVTPPPPADNVVPLDTARAAERAADERAWRAHIYGNGGALIAPASSPPDERRR
jgi:hypothetical protein